ncbi:MAG: hypothetical protein II336_03400 [Loktanella sp.]|nr:hypothetical protein [Loktanella sp.]
MSNAKRKSGIDMSEFAVPRNLDDPKVYAEAEKHFGCMIMSSEHDLSEQKDRLEEIQYAMYHASQLFGDIANESIAKEAVVSVAYFARSSLAQMADGIVDQSFKHASELNGQIIDARRAMAERKNSNGNE